MNNNKNIYIYNNNVNFCEKIKNEKRFLKNNKYLIIINAISINR